MHEPLLNIAIIGGGFSGAALAYHLARQPHPALAVTVFEPRAALGAGLAYSTPDPAHRLNARAQRMSLLPDDAAHFCDWIKATGACADDELAVLPDGRIFPRRAIYGRYIADQLAPLLATGAVRHVQAAVQTISRQNPSQHAGWTIQAGQHPPAHADILILATGHAPPEAPARLAAPFARHPGFIADPTIHGAVDHIPPAARVLIVGTGLTMADIVAALHRRRHTGPILAISRRGQSPRAHAVHELPPFGCFDSPPPPTARILLAQIAEALAAAEAQNIGWQSVFDALRCQAPAIWANFPHQERSRLLRHARPFWDVHRHRLPPQVSAVLAQRIAAGRLEIRAATIAQARLRDGHMRVTLRRRGAATLEEQEFDSVIVTTGPGRPDTQPPTGPLPGLFQAGLIRPDPYHQGLDCDAHSRALDHQGKPNDRLLIAGPLARGQFGELMSVPEITVQARDIAAALRKQALLF